MSAELRAAWADAVAAASSEDPNAAAAAERFDRVWCTLFGEPGPWPWIPAGEIASDVAWLVDRGPDGVALERLATWFRIPVPDADHGRGAVLHLCHLLATAEPDDPLFFAMTAAQWRAKWLDAATFAYVGLREIDGLATLYGRNMGRRQPRVVVEPLPEVWRSLQAIAHAHERIAATARGPGRTELRHWLDDVVEALAIQQRNEDLPQQLEARLFSTLLHGRAEQDSGLGSRTQIEGTRGEVRRAVPHLVRLPIRWRGETRWALALRLWIEQEVGAGEWQGPPWGADLSGAR
ncbi:MAG: hypothetical protein JNK15_13425 [Planctomycetes bacterium]|nr:hypothetical protein [Planctomycetota bacterium]